MNLRDVGIVQKTAKIQLNGFGEMVEIPALGDGNCAPNSFALALIDLIQRDALQLTQAQFDTLKEAMRATLAVLIARKNKYQSAKSSYFEIILPELAEDIENFISLVDNRSLTKDVFVDYIKRQLSQKQIAALHIALAPALRSLGVDLYERLLKESAKAEDVSQFDVQNLRNDKDFAGEEILHPLAREFFNINLTIIEAGKPYVKHDDIKDRPTISLIHRSAHWNYLIPVTQKDGLAKLPESKVEVKSDNAKVYDTYSAILELHGKISRTNSLEKTELKTLTEKVHQATQVVASSPEEQASLANLTDQIVNTVIHSKTLDVSDRKLSELHLNQHQKELFNRAIPVKDLNQVPVTKANISQVDTDEALARTLQNEEILGFLESHYDSLKPGASSSAATQNVDEKTPSRGFKRS